MHDVPRDAVGEHMGFKDEVLKRDDLDERLARTYLSLPISPQTNQS